MTADWDYDPLRPRRRRGDLSTHPILIPALLAALIRNHHEDQEEDHD